MGKINTIYLDMDGVLCDHNAYWKVYFGCTSIREDPNVEENWNKAVNDQHMFEKLEWCPGARMLIRVIDSLPVNVEILSSISHRSNNILVRDQKITWLMLNNLRHLKTNFVTTKKEKANYAASDTLLIDDSEGCVNPFVQAGGNAILHNNTKKTIMELGKYF